jgi:hypothetical protein
MAQSSSPSPSSSSTANIGVVQDIIAVRLTPNNSKEYLVTWKPSWIPEDNMECGDVLVDFNAAPKCVFSSAVGKLMLTVPPDTESSMAEDIANIAARPVHQMPPQQFQPVNNVGGTPRKSLGGVAKKTAPAKESHHH